MDSVKQAAHKHQDKFKFLVFAGAGIAALNTLARADYNLMIYLYIYYVWNHMNDSKEAQVSEKINSFFMLLYSLLIDIIWVIFWGNRWGMPNDHEATIHSIVIFCSWVAIVLKIVALLFIGIIEWGSIKSSLPNKLKEKLNAGNNYGAQMDEPNA